MTKKDYQLYGTKVLKEYKAQMDELAQAATQGEDAYKAKFKEIFGVDFNYTAIVAHQKAESEYINAKTAKDKENNFNKAFALLLRQAPLCEETETVSAGPKRGFFITLKS